MIWTVLLYEASSTVLNATKAMGLMKFSLDSVTVLSRNTPGGKGWWSGEGQGEQLWARRVGGGGGGGEEGGERERERESLLVGAGRREEAGTR